MSVCLSVCLSIFRSVDRLVGRSVCVRLSKLISICIYLCGLSASVDLRLSICLRLFDCIYPRLSVSAATLFCAIVCLSSCLRPSIYVDMCGLYVSVDLHLSIDLPASVHLHLPASVYLQLSACVYQCDLSMLCG